MHPRHHFCRKCFPCQAGRRQPVEPLIRDIRGERVILDADLSRIYGVPTKRLNEQVRRNADRFPPDFLFRLTADELDSMRSQFATASDFGPSIRSQNATASKRNVRFLPYAFTEHGAIMAANVLNSPQAVQLSVFVVRAFVALRRDLGRYAALRRKLADLERAQKLQGEDLQEIFAALRQLEETTSWAYPDGRRLIGFQPEQSKKDSQLK